jgi:Permease family
MRLCPRFVTNEDEMTDTAVRGARSGAPNGDDKQAVHPVDQLLPWRQNITLGIQHLFIMYAGAVAVPLIVGPAVGLAPDQTALLIAADLLVSGICTIIQAAPNRSHLRGAVARRRLGDVHGAEPR